jgi:hypothetical protein
MMIPQPTAQKQHMEVFSSTFLLVGEGRARTLVYSGLGRKNPAAVAPDSFRKSLRLKSGLSMLFDNSYPSYTSYRYFNYSI